MDFSLPLRVTVTSSAGEPVDGGTVTFTPPASGASAGITGSPASIGALGSGSASAYVTANSIPGSYSVTASARGAASVDFSLENIAPDTTITGGQPADPTNSTTASFSFSGSSGVGSLTFECQLDSGGYTACTSPKEYSSLADSSHTFEVRAVDSNNIKDPTPASYTWVVDTTRPTVTISSMTSNTTNTSPIPVTVLFSESVTGFTIDSIVVANATKGDFSGSGASYSLTLTPSGQVTVTGNIAADVAADAAGNTNTAATQFSRTYDITNPAVTAFAAGPVSHSLAIPVGAFTASDTSGIAGYMITQSSTAPAAGDSGWSGSAPATYTVERTGAYILYPWVKDPAGNVSAEYGSPQTVLVCFATVSVTSDADNGTGTLRRAIADSCDNATISFADDYTIILADELAIDKNLTIDGAGRSVTIDGDNSTRVFSVSSGITFNLQNLTVAGGKADGGGGIYNNGTTNVANCTISGNSAGGSGGGILNYPGRTLRVVSSTISGNSAADGGGIYNFGPLTLTNSTISANTASSYGGGLYNRSSTVTLTNNTFSGNSASYGGGMYSISTVKVNNSIIAASVSGDNCAGTGSVSGVSNLADDDTCGTSFTNSSSILLEAPGAFGGSTYTMPLLPGSSALDSGNDTYCPATDQRGIARPQGGGCDIGAFESRGFTLAITGGNQQSTDINTLFAEPLALTVSETGGSGLPGVVVAFTAPSSGASLTQAAFTATADAEGIASATVTANGVAGSYTVTAGASGAASVDFSLTNVVPTTTTTSVASTTTTVPACSVRIIPKRLGWLIGEKVKTRMLLVIGEREAAYDENTEISWDSDAIEIRNKRVFLKRFMFMTVSFDGSQLEKGDYTLSVDSCTGTVHMVR